MSHARARLLILMLALSVCFAAGPVLAQAQGTSPADAERVQVIVTKPAAATGKGAKAPPSSRMADEFKKHSAETTGQSLSMTKAEVWSVPKSELEGLKKMAAKHGATVTELGPDSYHLFRAPPADMTMSKKQKAVMDKAKAAKSTNSVKLVTGPAPAMLEHALTSNPKDGLPKIAVTLSDDKVLTINRTSVDIKPDRAIWRGTVESTGALVTLMFWPNGKMTGMVRNDGHIHAIRHIKDSVYAIVDMSEEKMPQEHAPMPERMRVDDPNLRDESLTKQGDASVLREISAAKQPQPRAQKNTKQQLAYVPAGKPTPPKAPAARADPSTKDVVIDVIVAYTPKAASHYMDIKRELIEFAIEEANESFSRSGLEHIKLRLVNAYQTNYVEQGGHFDHLWRFHDKDGYMDEIHGLRDKYKADVAVLIVDDPQGCGLSTRVYASQDDAFSVVHHGCAAMTYSLAHEIGHLIGARHDLNMDDSKTPFPYGHGYVRGTKWRDIMSYKESCDGCTRLPVWSGPKVIVNGEPAGSDDLDNSRVIMEQAARVAGFR
jgi:Metallo-peptidase family M12